MKPLKQMIVMRHDLGMRRGKQIAQGAHASVLALTETGLDNPTIKNWADQGMPKICVRVNSEQELFDIQTQATENGLPVFVVRDEGRTEFNGVVTPTCLAIGPADSDAIDAVTGNLSLL